MCVSVCKPHPHHGSACKKKKKPRKQAGRGTRHLLPCKLKYCKFGSSLATLSSAEADPRSPPPKSTPRSIFAQDRRNRSGSLTCALDGALISHEVAVQWREQEKMHAPEDSSGMESISVCPSTAPAAAGGPLPPSSNGLPSHPHVPAQGVSDGARSSHL